MGGIGRDDPARLTLRSTHYIREASPTRPRHDTVPVGRPSLDPGDDSRLRRLEHRQRQPDGPGRGGGIVDQALRRREPRIALAMLERVQTDEEIRRVEAERPRHILARALRFAQAPRHLGAHEQGARLPLDRAGQAAQPVGTGIGGVERPAHQRIGRDGIERLEMPLGVEQKRALGFRQAPGIDRVSWRRGPRCGAVTRRCIARHGSSRGNGRCWRWRSGRR